MASYAGSFNAFPSSPLRRVWYRTCFKLLKNSAMWGIPTLSPRIGLLYFDRLSRTACHPELVEGGQD